MRKKLFNLAAKFMAVAMMLSTLSFALPASAADATSISDTMSSIAASATGVTHTVSMTLPTGYADGSITLTYDSGFSNFAFGSATCNSGTVANNSTGTNVASVTTTGCAATDTLTIVFTGDNPSATGNKVTTISGAVQGTYAEDIISNDSITVSATVSPSLTFAVGATTTTCTTSLSSPTYTLDLGTVDSGTVVKSDTSSVKHVCTLLSTNATGGAKVSVKDANAGMTSASASNTVSSATATVTAGTDGYGLCTFATHSGQSSGSATISETSPYSGACGSNAVGALSSTFAQMEGISGPTSNAYDQFGLVMAVAGTTPAASDYTDTLTFRATGTF